MIKDLIGASRRLASLYKYEKMDPSHLLHALTGIESAREIILVRGFDVLMMRASLMRSFKDHSTSVRHGSDIVHASEMFDSCIAAVSRHAIGGSQKDFLERIFDEILAFESKDSTLQESLRASKIDEIEKSKATLQTAMEDFDDLLMHPDFDDDSGGFLPLEAYTQSPMPKREKRDPQSRPDSRESLREKMSEARRSVTDKKPTKEQEEILSSVSGAQRDLTEAGMAGLLDPVFGRDADIDRMIEILLRKRKPNIILVAEPGVGKSAIIEGLAMRLLQDDTLHEDIRSRHVVDVSLNSLVAGTRYRGDFEARMARLIEEAEKANLILFMDEFHMIMGAGSVGKSGLDGHNILKPSLARDGFSLIGATTPQEAAGLREDAALMRRFEMVYLQEPSNDDMVDILQNSSESFLKKHGVQVDLSMIKKILYFGDRYLTEKRNPDRSFDILDIAGVKAKLRGAKSIEESDIRAAVLRLGGDIYTAQTSHPSDAETLVSSIAGQLVLEPVSLIDLKKALNAWLSRSLPQDTIVLSGPVGSGKAALATAVSDRLGQRLQKLDASVFIEEDMRILKSKISMILESNPKSIFFMECESKHHAGRVSELISSIGSSKSSKRPIFFVSIKDVGSSFAVGIRSAQAEDASAGQGIRLTYLEGDNITRAIRMACKDFESRLQDAGRDFNPSQKEMQDLESRCLSASLTYGDIREKVFSTLNNTHL